MKASPSRRDNVSYRAILLAFLLIPGNALRVAYSESVWGIAYLTIAALFFNVVTTLFSSWWRITPRVA